MSQETRQIIKSLALGALLAALLFSAVATFLSKQPASGKTVEKSQARMKIVSDQRFDSGWTRIVVYRDTEYRDTELYKRQFALYNNSHERTDLLEVRKGNRDDAGLLLRASE